MGRRRRGFGYAEARRHLLRVLAKISPSRNCRFAPTFRRILDRPETVIKPTKRNMTQVTPRTILPHPEFHVPHTMHSVAFDPVHILPSKLLGVSWLYRVTSTIHKQEICFYARRVFEVTWNSSVTVDWTRLFARWSAGVVQASSRTVGARQANFYNIKRILICECHWCYEWSFDFRQGHLLGWDSIGS